MKEEETKTGPAGADYAAKTEGGTTPEKETKPDAPKARGKSKEAKMADLAVLKNNVKQGDTSQQAEVDKLEKELA
jgi:hypothetical protein